MSDSMGKAVYEAAKDGKEAELTRLIGLGGNVNWRDGIGDTALLYATCNGHEGCVRLLLEAEAIEVNATNNYDWTALHNAAYWGHLAIAKRLLEGGADPTLRNKWGKTAIDYARERGKSEVVALLSEPRDWKAEAAKAKADKAAAAKAAADKAAADKAEAEKAGAHSTESARVAAAKVVPAAEPAALSLLLNHWGAAARRCLSTCVGGATALPERRAVASSSAPPFFLASAPVSVLDRAKRLVESRGGEYAAGDKDDIFNSMTLGDQESWKVGWKGKVEMLINILKKHNPGRKVTALAIAGGPACDWERGELHNTFCSNHRELVLKQLGDMEDLEFWLDRYHPASPGDGYAA